MNSIVADLHLHSKYSRAVSPLMTLDSMIDFAKIKGINLLGTGDFTHPDWFVNLKSDLVETSQGIYQVKVRRGGQYASFVIGGEISCIYTQNGRGRRVHIIVLLPSLAVAEKVNTRLKQQGCNLLSDGRPVIPLSVKELLETLFTIDLNIIVIPAHIWTPWFGILGAKSGFDSLRECCGEYADNIYAIETGLSSNPDMNWQVSELNNRSILSFSDAHSLEKLGRELTIFQNREQKLQNQTFTYQDLNLALKDNGIWEIANTVEFYPQEGKYYMDGHRLCKINRLPEEIIKIGRTCPICGKLLTPGVLGRVQQLSDQTITVNKIKNDNDVLEYTADKGIKKPFWMLVPLATILAEVYQSGEKSQKVVKKYNKLIENFGSELDILSRINIEDIERASGGKIAQAIAKVRIGDIFVYPGFDGQFGKIRIWPNIEDIKSVSSNNNIQELLF